MLSAIEFLHKFGVSHRYLKPENIMLDGQFNVKISESRFAAPIEGRNGLGYLHSYVGTLCYMAPEIIAIE